MKQRNITASSSAVAAEKIKAEVKRRLPLKLPSGKLCLRVEIHDKEVMEINLTGGPD